MQETWIYSIPSFLYVLFHLTALILSLVFWRRHPKVCLLLLFGSILNLLALGARIVLPMLWFARFEGMMMFAVINVAFSLVSLCGSGLYLAAVFAGRSGDMPRRWPPRDEPLAARPRADDGWPPPTVTPVRTEPGSTGIQEH